MKISKPQSLIESTNMLISTQLTLKSIVYQLLRKENWDSLVFMTKDLYWIGNTNSNHGNMCLCIDFFLPSFTVSFIHDLTMTNT